MQNHFFINSGYFGLKINPKGDLTFYHYEMSYRELLLRWLLWIERSVSFVHFCLIFRSFFFALDHLVFVRGLEN